MQDNSDKNKDGTRCMTTVETMTMRPHYDAYVIEQQSQGQEYLSYDSWLNSQGMRNCSN